MAKWGHATSFAVSHRNRELLHSQNADVWPLLRSGDNYSHLSLSVRMPTIRSCREVAHNCEGHGQHFTTHLPLLRHRSHAFQLYATPDYPPPLQPHPYLLLYPSPNYQNRRHPSARAFARAPPVHEKPERDLFVPRLAPVLRYDFQLLRSANRFPFRFTPLYSFPSLSLILSLLSLPPILSLQPILSHPPRCPVTFKFIA